MKKDKVVNALIAMGMPADINGFHYITDAMLLLEDTEWRNCKTTALYQKIAKINNVSTASVERAIRHAFHIVLTKGDSAVIDKYLTRLNATNSNLLHVFYIRLTQEE